MKSKKNLRKHTRKVKKKFNKQKKYRKNYSRKRENKTVRNTKSKNLKGRGRLFGKIRSVKVAPDHTPAPILSIHGNQVKFNKRTIQSEVLPDHIKYGFFKKFVNINSDELNKIYEDAPSRLDDGRKIILALYANPQIPGYPPLVINKEINILFNKLQQNLKLDALFTGTSLESNCQMFNPEIILYSGHALINDDGLNLFLHNESNLRRGILFGIQDFINPLFKITNLKLVILLACHTFGIQEYLSKRDNINNKCQPSFITFDGQTLDDAMISFLDGCADKIQKKYNLNDTIDPHEIYNSGIAHFKRQGYIIGNPADEGQKVHAKPMLITKESYL